MEANGRTVLVDPPSENYPARVDDKGRLKLPADVQRFLAGFFSAEAADPKVFVTTLDKHTVRIYPNSVWKQNELLLEQENEASEQAEDLLFLAKHYGGTSEVDTQGRILVPPELRRKLKMENQPVWLNCMKGGITVYSNDLYEERLRRAEEGLDEKVVMFKKKGLR